MRAILAGLLDLVAPRRCAACDRETMFESSVFCRPCETLAARYHGVGAVFEYGGSVADAIARFKYEGHSELGSSLGALMAEEAGIWGERIDGVVPVPLHWRRRRTRGYDQAALLARPVARALRVPVLLRCLTRRRNTSSQVELPHEERFKNVRGAFLSRALKGSPRLLLVDDVRTTGATLAAASDALRMAGAGEVQTLVLAVRVLGGAT